MTSPLTITRAVPPEGRILTVNGGSSSLKFALFESGNPPTRRLSGVVDRIGFDDCAIRASGHEVLPIPAVDHERAVDGLLNWLDTIGELNQIAAVGHRIVHGGARHTDSQVVTAELLSDLRDAIPLAPSHLPSEIGLIEALAKRLPDVPQVACFDTAFHRDLPARARLLPIPRRYETVGIRRYGFHGLSYAYLMERLEALDGADAAKGRVVLAHLGSGASMAAVLGGRCIDTTMGLTPDGGLVMGTRSGDLDPGVLIYLARTEGLSSDALEDLVTRKSGMIGISETSSDMRDLLSRQTTDARASEAVEIFCYQARKWIGALAAALEGLDVLVFAGGIGEHASEVRAKICDGLGFLGVRLDPSANEIHADVISSQTSAVKVRVTPTDEETMIAQTVLRLAGGLAH